MKYRFWVILIFVTVVFLQYTIAQTLKKYSWENLPVVQQPVFKTDTFNIKKFNALSDGTTSNTQAINMAINACNLKGGGVVLIPRGLWLTGPLVMKSHVNLHLERGALLQFTDDKSQYRMVDGFFEGQHAIRCQSPISGIDLTNNAITGEGIVDGHGEAWRAVNKSSISNDDWGKIISSGGILNETGDVWYPSAGYSKGVKLNALKNAGTKPSQKEYEETKDFYRPNLLVFNNCRNVLLEGTTFQNSPAWCLHTLLCENLTLKGVHIRNDSNAQNADGMDIESCSYVLVENCTLDCGDDGICIKSGKNEEGRKLGKPSQYVIVRNSVVYKAHGGFVIGSEMSGGARDIFVSDCTFIGTDNGLRFKTVRGRGGVVENIFIKNITMRNIGRDAILFDMYYFTQAPILSNTNGKVDIPLVNDGTPQFHNFYIDGLVCDGAERAMLIRGLPEMNIKGIHIANVSIKSKRGAEIVEAQDCSFDNVRLLTSDSSTHQIYIENSQKIKFNRITGNSAKKFLKISGTKCNRIEFKKNKPVLTLQEISFNYGAEITSVNILN